MHKARVGDLELAYTLEGPADGVPLVLIMGFGGQLVAWPPELVAQLAERGFRCLLFDHRDIGESTWLDDAPAPNMTLGIVRWLAGAAAKPPYTLADMAGDVVGLMDHLGWADAHVFGISMGGMVAQQMAIDHPARMRTLTSMMSHTGRLVDAVGRPDTTLALLGMRSSTREEHAQATRALFEKLNGPHLDAGGPHLEESGRRAWDRGLNPAGVKRQLAAIMGSPPRTKALQHINVPTLVIHGDADPLIPVRGGRRTAWAIPNARLEIIPGLGHSLPPAVWPQLAELLAGHAGLAGRAS